MIKKLIGFPEEMFAEIEVFIEKNELNLTEGVRQLIAIGLMFSKAEEPPDENQETDNVKEGEGDCIDLITLNKKVDKLIEDKSFWNADETQSRLGNAELKIKEMDKRINVLTSVSKLFKKHLNNREIHMQD